MRRFRFWFIPLALFIASAVSAAVNWTVTTHAGRQVDTVVYQADLQSDISGAASAPVTMYGKILRATVTPTARAYTVTTNTLYAWPVNSWDCTLTDEASVDLMDGTLANNLMTTSRSIDFYRLLTSGVGGVPVPVAGSLVASGPVTLACTGMGTFRNASIRFYVEQ